MKQGLPPIYSRSTKCLIIGSGPSDLSISKQQYYGNPGNQFWRIVFHALNQTDPKNYQLRIEQLLTHYIGLWDVYEKFNRQGSLDSQFKESYINDFQPLLKELPITTIIVNGYHAWKIVEQHRLFTNLQLFKCGSTSGANNGREKERLIEWTTALSNFRQ